jgi:hypothetical protein
MTLIYIDVYKENHHHHHHWFEVYQLWCPKHIERLSVYLIHNNLISLSFLKTNTIKKKTYLWIYNRVCWATATSLTQAQRNFYWLKQCYCKIFLKKNKGCDNNTQSTFKVFFFIYKNCLLKPMHFTNALTVWSVVAF